MTEMKFAKTDARYWERKVGFQTPASRTFSVQIQHANRRMIIGLGTANRAQAAFEARHSMSRSRRTAGTRRCGAAGAMSQRRSVT